MFAFIINDVVILRVCGKKIYTVGVFVSSRNDFHAKSHDRVDIMSIW